MDKYFNHLPLITSWLAIEKNCLFFAVERILNQNLDCSLCTIVSFTCDIIWGFMVCNSRSVFLVVLFGPSSLSKKRLMRGFKRLELLSL
jgi:hypothetical protein